MHSWGWIWPATLFGWCLFWIILSNSSTFSKIFFPGNGRPGWPTYSEKYTHLLIRCPNIYFCNFTFGFQMFKAIFQAISTFYHWSEAIAQTYFSILPLVFSSCSTSSACFVHQFFKSVLLLLPLIFVCCFSRFLINLKTHFLFKNALLGLDLTGYPFWMMFILKHTF